MTVRQSTPAEETTEKTLKKGLTRTEVNVDDTSSPEPSRLKRVEPQSTSDMTSSPGEETKLTVQAQLYSIDDDESQTDPQNFQYLRKLRACAGVIVNNSHFQLFILILILVNSILMGVATFNFVAEDPHVTSVFATVDKTFLIIFTVEICLQFIYRGLYLFTDGWLVFDLAIVVMSWSLDSLQIIRTFRVFRALRLITRVKMLKELVSAIFSVGPRMCGITCLLVLIVYIYGVMCTILFKDLYKNGYTKFDYFSRLDLTCWNLLVILTLDWAFIARQVMAVYPLSWMVFVSFVLITSFMVYNLIVAVVCDSVHIIAQMRKAEDEAGIETEEEKQLSSIKRMRDRIDMLTKQQQDVFKTIEATLAGMDADVPRLEAQT